MPFSLQESEHERKDIDMYFMIKNKIIFRQYSDYGYLTDNSLFGYNFLNDKNDKVGERYVSESGAYMLAQLKKTPVDFDSIVEELLKFFVDVKYDELKKDTYGFFMELVGEGFLAVGDSVEECIHEDTAKQNEKSGKYTCEQASLDNCLKNANDGEFLRSIHIEVANECNERCIHCYIPHHYKTSMIESSLFFHILDQARSLNIINITISGGEPLLHRDIILFLKKCREYDFSVNVLSNLTLLTEEIIQEMKLNPLLCVQTSIYSMNPNTHDMITKVKGSFAKTVNSVYRLISEGIPVQISCPIMKQNKDDFMDVVKWGGINNISVLYDYVIFAEYDHSNQNLVNRLSLEEISEAFDLQNTQEISEYWDNLAKEKCDLCGEDPICSICRYYFCITAEGYVYPCVGWQSKILGNANVEPLKQIWETSMEICKLRNIKRKDFPKCCSCEDRGYCTVCMMSNANENKEGDIYKIEEYHCKVASLIHKKVDSYLRKECITDGKNTN